MINRAIRAAIATATRAAGVEVTYTRPATGDSCTLDAVPVRPVSEVEREHALLIRAERRDWLITAGDLVFDAVQVEPEAGDTLTHGEEVYEVAGEPPAELVDADHYAVRIHTNRIT